MMKKEMSNNSRKKQKDLIDDDFPEIVNHDKKEEYLEYMSKTIRKPKMKITKKTTSL